MKKKLRMVTFNIVVYSKSDKDAIEIIESQLHRWTCPICNNEIGEYIGYHKLTKPLAVKEMVFDKEKGESIIVGNGGD